MSYVRFIEMLTGTKTKRWEVSSKVGGGILGIVKWFGAWRKYAFFPHDNCVFEEDCLRDIAEFCETNTRLRREQRAVERKAEQVCKTLPYTPS